MLNNYSIAFDNDSLKNQNSEHYTHCPRGRPKGKNPDTIRERLIRQAVALTLDVSGVGDREIIQAVQAALDGSAALIGVSGRYYLHDLRRSQQGYVRLVREVVALAASQQDKRVRVTAADLTEVQGLNGHRPLPGSLAGQGRESAQQIERSETLDRHTPKTLLSVPKTMFSGLPPGEGLVFQQPPPDNMGVGNCNTFAAGQNTLPGDTARPPGGDEDGAPLVESYAFDNDSYQNQ